jgi:REP element-mobilizing transposase RayT
MGRSRYGIDDPQAAHFFTCTIVNWLPVFTRPATVEIILDSFRYLQAERQMNIYGYVILENHLHLIAASEDIGRDVKNFKSYTAKEIVKCLVALRANTILKQMKFYKKRGKEDRDFQVWQEGSHPQEISSWDMMRQKLDYIHNNPVERGYVDLPEYWRYSSARNYVGEAGLIDVFMDWG